MIMLGSALLLILFNTKQNIVFFYTPSELLENNVELEEFLEWEKETGRNNKDDLAESFRRILEAAQKINPEEKAGYVINDQQGMRYFEIDYNNLEDVNT